MSEKKQRVSRLSRESRKYLAIAEKLAIRQGYDDNEIAAYFVGEVSVRWCLRHRKEGDWDKRRQEWLLSTEAVAEKAMTLLAREVETWDKLGKSEADTLVKAVKAIKGLDDEVDILGSTLTITEELANYLQRENQEGFDVLQASLPDFLQYMRDKYKKA